MPPTTGYTLSEATGLPFRDAVERVRESFARKASAFSARSMFRRR